jgi:hypothetical protein
MYYKTSILSRFIIHYEARAQCPINTTLQASSFTLNKGPPVLAMHSSKHSDVYLDLSAELRETQDWNIGTLRSIEYLLDIVNLAIEPLSGLLAVGTTTLQRSIIVK